MGGLAAGRGAQVGGCADRDRSGVRTAGRRRYLRSDLEQRLRARRTRALAIGLSTTKPLGVPARRTVDAGVEATT
jgi:hypothetical protein